MENCTASCQWRSLESIVRFRLVIGQIVYCVGGAPLCISEFDGTGLAKTTESNWYAVYTRPSHEKRVGDHFASRDIEFFLPEYRTTRSWKNRCKVELELPLFPTYIFARVAWSEHARLLAVPSVISIVGNGRKSLPLLKSEVEALRSGLTPMHTQPPSVLKHWRAGSHQIRSAGGHAGNRSARGKRIARGSHR